MKKFHKLGMILGVFVALGFMGCIMHESSNTHSNYDDDIDYVTVTFNTDGGSSVPSQRIPIHGNAVKPENPTKDGFIFSHWEDGYYGDLFSFNNIEQNTEVYAVWIKKPSLVKVDGGTFQMGSDEYSENPIHSVTVGTFYICDCEVTKTDYYVAIGWTGMDRRSLSDKPAGEVSWQEAVEFCNKLSELAGLNPCYTIDKNRQNPNYTGSNSVWTVTCDFSANGYRLPTEAEWEYAARGGNKSHGYTYSGSNSIGDVAVYRENAPKPYGVRQCTSVKSKAPNELGLYDMSGNLDEWCWDWYGDYSSEAQINPKGPSSGKYRVYRGGGHSSTAEWCTVTHRYRNEPADHQINDRYGIRLVRSSLN